MDETEHQDGVTPRMLKWAQNSALYRVSRQMLSRRQLYDAVLRKARQKFEDIEPKQAEALAERAVAFAESIGALDDEAFAKAKTRSAVRGGKSQRMIARTLSQKGIDRETSHAALADVDDLAAAVAFARKRAFGPFRRQEADDARREKELATYMRQGFRLDHAKQALAMSREEAEDVLAQLP